jgi:hypothetical protein
LPAPISRFLDPWRNSKGFFLMMRPVLHIWRKCAGKMSLPVLIAVWLGNLSAFQHAPVFFVVAAVTKIPA